MPKLGEASRLHIYQPNTQFNEMDLQYDLHGIEAAWQPKNEHGKLEAASWSGILPHPDLLSHRFTLGSAEHLGLWKQMHARGV